MRLFNVYIISYGINSIDTITLSHDSVRINLKSKYSQLDEWMDYDGFSEELAFVEENYLNELL